MHTGACILENILDSLRHRRIFSLWQSWQDSLKFYEKSMSGPAGLRIIYAWRTVMALQGLKGRFAKPAQQAVLAGMVTLGAAAAFAPGSDMAGDRIPVTPMPSRGHV